jgi:hypothetical protein
MSTIYIYANRSQMLNQLRRSGRNRVLAVAIAATFILLAARASAQSTYKDPGGGFTVNVPAGWNAQKDAQSSQVTISKGTASVSFDIEPTDDGSTPPAKDVLDGIEKQIVQQCPKAEVVKHGEATVAGQPGVSVKLTCKDPQHGTAMTTIAVATANGKVLIGNMTAYAGEYSGVKTAMEGIAGSIRLGGGGGDSRNAGAFRDAVSDRNNSPVFRELGGNDEVYGSSNQTSSNQASPNQDSGGNAQKLKALESACSSGVLSPEECAAKRAALTRGGSSSNSSGIDAQLRVLKRACDAGVFTPQECQAKLAALSEGGSNGGANGASNRGSNNNPNVMQSNDPNLPSAQVDPQRARRNDADPEQTTGGGNVYKDAHGAFSVMIPEGWNAKSNQGCYGSAENCPRNASGVNIQSPGRSWAFVAPFSGDARRPTDVVRAVADNIRSDYQNFQMLQNDPDKLNGLDIAIGHFTGVEQDGVGVSLVIIGIAAPGGRYFVAESSVPQNEIQQAGPALSSMPGTLRFASQ